jgi:hypothetical protein
MQRASLLASYFSEETSVETTFKDATFGRLSYVNAGTFVINRYDQGIPSESLNGALALLIPRFLWPDKPIYAPGADLAFLVSGREGNSISAGLFAESYWSFGWWGQLSLIIPFGAILAWASVRSLRVIERGDWIFAPALFFAIKMGLRVDGHYINDVIGSFAVLLGLYFVCHVVGASLGFTAVPASRARRF